MLVFPSTTGLSLANPYDRHKTGREPRAVSVASSLSSQISKHLTVWNGINEAV